MGSTGAAAAALPDGAFQTPLAFRRELLCDTVDRATREGWAATSAMELVLRAGHGATTGDVRKIKFTDAADWSLAQTLRERLA